MVYSLVCTVAMCSCFPSCVAAAVQQQQQQRIVGHSPLPPPVLVFSTQTNFIGSWYCWSSQGPPPTPAASHFFHSITWFISASLSPDVLVKLGNYFCFLFHMILIRIWCWEMEMEQRQNINENVHIENRRLNCMGCWTAMALKLFGNARTHTDRRTRKLDAYNSYLFICLRLRQAAKGACVCVCVNIWACVCMVFVRLQTRQ